MKNVKIDGPVFSARLQKDFFFSFVHNMDMVPTLEDRLDLICKCSSADLFALICDLSLESDLRVPLDFLSCLEDADNMFCWQVILICYIVKAGQQIPREMQLCAVLSDHHGLDCLIAAGTGSGKTLPTALKILLDDPAAALTTITLSPLKQLNYKLHRRMTSTQSMASVLWSSMKIHFEKTHGGT